MGAAASTTRDLCSLHSPSDGLKLDDPSQPSLARLDAARVVSRPCRRPPADAPHWSCSHHRTAESGLKRDDGSASSAYRTCEFVLLDLCDRPPGDRIDKPTGHAVADKSPTVVVGDANVHFIKQIKLGLGFLHEARRLQHVLWAEDHMFGETWVQDECLPRPFGRFSGGALSILYSVDRHHRPPE